MRKSLACLVVLLGCGSLVSAATIQVGPTRTYTTVLAGYGAASSGDVIEIDSGNYYQADGWVYVSGKHNLTFRGVGATRPVIDAGYSCYRQKGIFVIEIGTSNTTIENLELKNTRGNPAAGVRMQGDGLTLRNVYIHDSDNGVLNGGGTMLFEYCEFNHNGTGTGQTHNIYLNGTGTFTMQYCWSHNAVAGHQVKSRVQTNKILYNLISDDNGSGSYEIDIPQAGTSYIIGNCIYQGGYGNNSIVAYGEESASNSTTYPWNPDRHLYLVNNTIVTTIGGTFVWNASTTAALLQNNILQGSAGMSGPTNPVTNWITDNARLQNQGTYDYHPTANSIGAIGQGTAAGVGVDGFSLMPVSQYVHPYSREGRPASGTIDIGAYEYVVPNQPPTVDAGSDIDIYEGQPVSLHATASDPDNDPLSYAWQRTAGKNVFLIGSNNANPAFAAPTVATTTEAAMTLQVTVSDGKGGTASDSVNVRVRIRGDINHDDIVSMVDLLTLGEAWGTASGQPGYDPLCDLNNDGTVDVVDLLSLADNWTRTLQ